MKGHLFFTLFLLLLSPFCTISYNEEDSEYISIYGYLFDTPTPETWDDLVYEADIIALDSRFEFLTEGVPIDPENYPGYFEIYPVPLESHIHLISSSDDGYVTTVLTGDTPSHDLYLYAGSLFIYTAQDLEEILTSFGDCAVSQVIDRDEEGNGGFIYGWLDDGSSTEGAKIWSIVADGSRRDACYLNGDGVVDESLDGTSESGTFAIFNLPEGGVEVYVQPPSNPEWLLPFSTYIVEDGITYLGGFILPDEI